MNLKDKTKPTSCTECQRRKQKCSKEWPCNHCQARKVPHLCQFGQSKSGSTDAQSDNSRETRGVKRSNPDSEPSLSSSLVSQNDSDDDEIGGLKALGYMPGHAHFGLSGVDCEDYPKTTNPSSPTCMEETERLAQTLPSRSLTDSLVNNFLYNVNNRYNTIYPPTFVERYTKWWNDRGSQRNLDPNFTCLLLRVCAYSTQFMPPSLKNILEFELATKAQDLTERLFRAAERLRSTFRPEDTNLTRVQDLFLKAAWLKAESLLVQSWHTLGMVIREAQEIGLHNDTRIEGLTEFEIEIRRRIWTILWVWDWQMSHWLGRPRLMEGIGEWPTLPNLRLEESNSEPAAVSPFTHMVLQAQLARKISRRREELAGSPSPIMVTGLDAAAHHFINSLPPVFRLPDPDTSLDSERIYLPFQRAQLHAVIYLTLIDSLKPYLAKDYDTGLSLQEEEFRSKAIGYCLDLLQASQTLFEIEYPIYAKFHLVVFCIFDTATFLCSALLHDRSGTISKKEEIFASLDRAVAMLLKLSPLSKMAASAHKFLFNMLKVVLANSTRAGGESGSRKRIRGTNNSTATNGQPRSLDATAQHHNTVEPSAGGSVSRQSQNIPYLDHHVIGPPDPHMLTAEVNAVPGPLNTDISAFNLDEFLPLDLRDGSSKPEVGGLEQIWDWDSLNLEAFLDQGATRIESDQVF